MVGQQRSPRWLQLAIRSRQWALDEQIPALQKANAGEEAARLMRERVEAAVAGAVDARGSLLSREHFDVMTLITQSAFEQSLHRKALMAQQDEEEARTKAQGIRDEMQRSLGERDALCKRAEQTMASVRLEQARAAAREMDELWMLQRAVPEEG